MILEASKWNHRQATRGAETLLQQRLHNSYSTLYQSTILYKRRVVRQRKEDPADVFT